MIEWVSSAKKGWFYEIGGYGSAQNHRERLHFTK